MIVGKQGINIPAHQAMNHIAGKSNFSGRIHREREGYALALDMTSRTEQV